MVILLTCDVELYLTLCRLDVVGEVAIKSHLFTLENIVVTQIKQL